MASQLQVNKNFDITPFILDGNPKKLTLATMLQNGSTVDLEPYTIMSKIAANQTWVPLTDLVAVDGTNIPQGIYTGPTIPLSEIQAGDIENLEIILGGNISVDVNKLVLQNSLTLDDIITIQTGTNSLRTIRDYLVIIGIFTQEIVNTTEYQS